METIGHVKHNVFTITCEELLVLEPIADTYVTDLQPNTNFRGDKKWNSLMIIILIHTSLTHVPWSYLIYRIFLQTL